MTNSIVSPSAKVSNERSAVFGNRLKELRLSKGLSQAELAAQIHLSAPTITRYEQGLREPSLDILNTITKFFSVDFNYLLSRPDEMPWQSGNDLIVKFNALDDRGQSTVLAALEHEYTYASKK